MARVILHIGTHKTATTTIQNTFAANRALLARHGLVYPELGRVTGHHGLVMQWLPLPTVFDLPGGAAAGWARVAALARETGTVFLSSEEFSRGQPLPRVDLADLRRRLAPFDQVDVLCTLRDQLSYLQSIYLEVSKKHVPPPWPTFLANSLASGFGAGLFLDFNALDDFLQGAFARAEIHYLDFASSPAICGRSTMVRRMCRPIRWPPGPRTRLRRPSPRQRTWSPWPRQRCARNWRTGCAPPSTPARKRGGCWPISHL